MKNKRDGLGAVRAGVDSLCTSPNRRMKKKRMVRCNLGRGRLSVYISQQKGVFMKMKELVDRQDCFSASPERNDSKGGWGAGSVGK